MTASTRIHQLLEYYRLNGKQFSEAIGDKRPQRIYDVQKGKAKTISDSLSNQILSVFPEIDKVWLLTGEGEMLKDSANIDKLNNPEKRNPEAILKREAHVVPLIPTEALANSLSEYLGGNKKYRLPEYCLTGARSRICHHNQWRLNGTEVS